MGFYKLNHQKPSYHHHHTTNLKIQFRQGVTYSQHLLFHFIEEQRDLRDLLRQQGFSLQVPCHTILNRTKISTHFLV